MIPIRIVSGASGKACRFGKIRRRFAKQHWNNAADGVFYVAGRRPEMLEPVRYRSSCTKIRKGPENYSDPLQLGD
jgi:hypothetical protein